MEKIKIDSFTLSDDLDEYKKELYDKIINDKEVTKILFERGFTPDLIYKYIAICNDFYDDYYISKQIKSYEDCKKLNKYYFLNIYYQNYHVEQNLETYSFVVAEQKYQDAFFIKDLDDSYNHVSTKFINGLCINNSKDYGKLLSKNKKNNKWTYICGGRRSGKTSLAAYFLNNFINSSIKKGEYIKKVAYIDCKKRFNELIDLKKSKYTPNSQIFNEKLNEILNADFLVLDNLGDEDTSTEVRDFILLPILRERIKFGYKNIFISYYSVKDLIDLYRGSPLKNSDPKNKIRENEFSSLLASNFGETLQLSNLDNLF